MFPMRPTTSFRRRATGPVLALAIAIFTAGPAWAEGFDPEAIAVEVFALIQEARVEADVPAFERTALLDGVAAKRAALVASLAHADRLRIDEPIGAAVREAGLRAYRNVTVHLDMQRGYRYPASTFFLNWKKNPVWKTVMDPRFEAVGMATAQGDDGWIVLVAVLLDELVLPSDLGDLERRTIDAVNARRESRGLAVLIPDDNLSAVARRHSEDMARRNYFAHESPEGNQVMQRVRATGATYRGLAENIYRGHGLDDPADAAAAAWMKSRGHRKNILDGGFSSTGMGIAIDEDGQIYFTQVFANP